MKGKILFVDDEPIYIEGLIEKAQAEGYDIVLCDNVSDALKLVNKNTFDCIIIDIMMDPGDDLVNIEPHRAGIEAINILRNSKKHQPIICLSVISDQNVINRLKRKNVLYLRKGETPLKTAWNLIESRITGVYKSK